MAMGVWAMAPAVWGHVVDIAGENGYVGVWDIEYIAIRKGGSPP